MHEHLNREVETHEKFKDQGTDNATRPALHPQLTETEFLAWYWLKSELATFCRDHALPSSGSKGDLSTRVVSFLSGRPVDVAVKWPSRDTAPEDLDPSTVVTPGFRLSTKLRDFFVAHEGKGFHFNQSLRDFFRDPGGRKLGDALAIYRESKLQPKRPIAAQFQYNQHMRDFFSKNPQATMNEAREDWWKKRSARALAK